MTKQILIFLFSVFILSSCENKKNYKYVEIVSEENLSGETVQKEKEARVIKASSDSAAYLDAFLQFCIAVKVDKDMQASLGKTAATTIAFKLYDASHNEISSINFPNKATREKEILEKVAKRDNPFAASANKADSDSRKYLSTVTSIDTVKVKELEKSFRIKEDEFSNNNKKRYKPKSAPIYTNANGIYCYFQTENGTPGNLRFRLQYYNEDWLFFSRVQFSIDGKAYEYIPLDTETDSGYGGYIWEWFDESVLESDMELINALANAKSAKMKLIGQQYYDTRTISQAQINGFKQTLALYRAMGGQL